MSEQWKSKRRWPMASVLVLFPLATAVISAAQTTEIKTDAFASAGGLTVSATFDTYFIAGQSSPTGTSESASFTNIGGFFADFITPGMTTLTQNILIKANQINMISLNILPSLLAVETVLDDLETLVVAQNDAGDFYIPAFGVNTLGDVDVSNGLQVFISGSVDDTMINEGLALAPETLTHALDPTKVFMIGYPYQTAHAIVDVFASIAPSVAVVQDDAGQFWIPAFGVDTIGLMQPGKGYLIFVNEAVNFTYPAVAALPAASAVKVVALPEPGHFKFARTGLTYGVVLIDSKVALEMGDEIAVFHGDLCVGASVFAGDYPVVIAAWEGDEEHGLSGFTPGARIEVRVWKASDAEVVEAVASFASMSESRFRGGPNSAMSIESLASDETRTPSTFSLHQNYPNPFNPETQIRFDIPALSRREKVAIRLHIYNVSGQLVRVLLNEKRGAGAYEVHWDGRDRAGVPVPSGMYFYGLRAGDFRDTKRMILLK